MTRPELPAEVPWHDTDSNVFPHAARVDGQWWVLRLNGFPDHPLHTLFIDARVSLDLETLPVTWRLAGGRGTRPVLGEPERAEVIRLMVGLGPYGSEAGTPCTGDWCTCAALTDEYAALRRGG
ncbi:hypothetical protein ABT093_29505 [Kitasatospora sp. NPDC002551]|uniref:hypothetical protein n=1 Tax=unclassified Kitasatospora TaxID=2633591 RepID=UPI00332D8C32